MWSEVKWKLLGSVRLFVTPWNSPWSSPGQNTGVGSRSHLLGIVPTQGLNPGLPLCRWILYQLSHQGSPGYICWLYFIILMHLDSILKSRDITLLTKVCPVKPMVFPVVMYGCESWTTKKAEWRRTNAFELWCWRRPLRIPWIARRSNLSILKKISPEHSLEGRCWSWNSNALAT